MPASKIKATKFNSKGINLLKDVYGREQVRKQVYVVYRSLSVVYVFVLVIFSGIWGWTLYQTNKLNSLESAIELKTAELQKFESVVKTILAYSARVDQIDKSRGPQDESFVVLYDQMKNIKEQANGVLVRYKFLPAILELTFNLEDEQSVHWLENLVNQNIKNKKWSNMQIASVKRMIDGNFEVTLTTKLGKSKS